MKKEKTRMYVSFMSILASGDSGERKNIESGFYYG